MKQLLFLFTFILFSLGIATAQVPQGFNYQAMIKDSNDHPISDEAIDIEVKINKNFSTVYCETHENAAVEQGLLNLVIGTGMLCGPETELSEVDWSTGEFTMEVTVTDMAGATVSGESPLVSVPFAMHAGTVEKGLWVENGNQVYLDSTITRVGIGTNNPDKNLQIFGEGDPGEYEEGEALIHSNWQAEFGKADAGRVLAGSYADQPALQGHGMGTSYNLLLNPYKGNVGIGTATPARLFHAMGTTSTSIVARIESQNGNGATIDFKDPNTTGDWKARIGGKGDGLTFIAGGLERMNILQNGNVGIGTTSPSQKLHIENGNLFVRRTAPWIHLQESDNGDKNWYMVVDGKYFSVRENNTSTQRFTIAEGGNIGIGAPTPTKAKVQIEGSATHNPGSSFWTYFNTGSTTTPLTFLPSGGNRSLSLYASSGIAANRFHAFSDARIKNVNGISDGEKDLETLKKIEITDYTYKDQIAKGTTPQKKVIAQQVAEVYPQAVTANNTEIIPDIMQSAEVSEGWVQLSNHGLSEGDKVRLIFEERTAELEVTEVTNEGFRVATDHEGKVFVYGREVDDFHTVDYEAIAMLNVSATQELAKIIEQQQAEIQALKAANSNVLTRLEALEVALGRAASATASTDK